MILTFAPFCPLIIGRRLFLRSRRQCWGLVLNFIPLFLGLELFWLEDLVQLGHTEGYASVFFILKSACELGIVVKSIKGRLRYLILPVQSGRVLLIQQVVPFW